VLTGNIESHTHDQYLTEITSEQVDEVLTQDIVEKHLAGDVQTHTHSQYLTALYTAQVYDTLPDLATLAEWQEADGTAHPYVYGNDIYVKDDTDPSGYANYRLAPLGWQRIAQVPAGYQIVLVKTE
jgi:hypothetical protein